MVRGWPTARDIEQIRQFLDGTADIVFSNPTNASALPHLCSISMALGHPASAATSRNGTPAIPLLPLEQRAARRVVCNVLSFAKNYFRNGCYEAFTLTRKPGCPFWTRLFALVAKRRRLAYGHPTGHPRRTAYRTTPTQRHRPK